jgi:acetyl esterase/lipase
MTLRPTRALLFAVACLAGAYVSAAADKAPATPKKSADKSGAVTYAQIPGPIRLWAGDTPGAQGQRPQDIPTLTPFAADPAKRNGATMLILPGGGYGNLAEHEGTGYAQFFAAHGITAYVLKYRLGSNGYRHPIMLNDAARALRLLRTFARRDGLDPNRIGVIGSSAGGHLASTLLTLFEPGNPSATDPVERESARPDLGILCYPVISLGEFAHAGSRRNLLGDNPPADLVQKLSTELQVTKNTLPPLSSGTPSRTKRCRSKTPCCSPPPSAGPASRSPSTFTNLARMDSASAGPTAPLRPGPTNCSIGSRSGNSFPEGDGQRSGGILPPIGPVRPFQT